MFKRRKSTHIRKDDLVFGKSTTGNTHPELDSLLFSPSEVDQPDSRNVCVQSIQNDKCSEESDVFLGEARYGARWL